MRLPTTPRSGFTLIEILIVLGIMLVLMSIGVGAALKGFAWVQQSNTEVVMRKVQERLARRYDQIVLEARGWESSLIYRLAAGNPKRAEALKIKLLYKWSFPMNYQEAINNVAESAAYGYAPQGYPFAVAVLSRLQSNVGNGAGLAPATRAGLQAALGITPGEDLRNQNAACLFCVFNMTLGSSVDELAPSEIGKYPTSPNAAAPFDNNYLVIDSWGTPCFCMRYGNLVTNAQNYAWLTQVLGPSGAAYPPTEVAYNPAAPAYTFAYNFFGDYYSPLVDRAKTAFPHKYQRSRQQAIDQDDPESTLALGWRTQLNPGWQFAAPVPPFTTNGNDTAAVNSAFKQMFGYYLTTFGPGAGSPDDFPRMYAPLVLLSAGPDKNFPTWDDNLDTYRMTTRVGTQQ